MNIGFIGLGVMGKPMAKNLLEAGYQVFAYDVIKENVQNVAEAGAVACTSIREVCESCRDIITMLPNSPHVRAVTLGEGGIAECATEDTLVIDMSSIAPGASKEICAELQKKGIRMVDAPVSGGEPKAVDGTLAIMVGGEQENFERALPLFKVMGSSYNLIGGIGSGNTCKLANQVIVAINIAALSEGLMLACRAGADPEKVFEGIRGGLAGSTVMNAKAPMILDHNFKPGFRIDLHIKDLNNAMETGVQFGAPLPLTTAVQDMLKNLTADGWGSDDHSALARYYEKITGVSLQKDDGN